MVTSLFWVMVTDVAWLLSQVAPVPDPRARQITLVKLIAALILLTIGGAALVVLSWLALRSGRRYVNRPGEAGTLRAEQLRDDWARKPLGDHSPRDAEDQDA